MCDEEEKTEYQKEFALYEHTPYYKINHPEREKYIHLLDLIDYRKSRDEWKDAYYSYFFDVSPVKDRTKFLKFSEKITFLKKTNKNRQSFNELHRNRKCMK